MTLIQNSLDCAPPLHLVPIVGAWLWPKAKAPSLKKGFRLDFGSRLPDGRWQRPVARTESIWVKESMDGLKAGRWTRVAHAVSDASLFLLLVEGLIDWKAIACCQYKCRSASAAGQLLAS